MVEKRRIINAHLRKTFSDLYSIYSLMLLAHTTGQHHGNVGLRSELAKLWKNFELAKLVMRRAHRDAREERTLNRTRFNYWLRNQREIQMIVEHEENNAGTRTAA